jgi:transposase InsO family protein
LIHIDVKKLGRIHQAAGHRITGNRPSSKPRRTDSDRVRHYTIGWEYVHIAVDDCTRLAYAEVLSDEKGTTAVGFLRRAIAFFQRHGITVERVMTDNGSPYISTLHALACRRLHVKHLRTRPRRPQTNGKAERFIRTLLGGWAYGASYRTSSERTAALDGWLWHYNHHHKHSVLSHQPPITRVTNLLGTYRYWRSRPLVFSLVPRCHGLCGSQKYTCRPVSIRSCACWAISAPWSQVNDGAAARAAS